jgi:hypothetical protein
MDLHIALYWHLPRFKLNIAMVKGKGGLSIPTPCQMSFLKAIKDKTAIDAVFRGLGSCLLKYDK